MVCLGRITEAVCCVTEWPINSFWFEMTQSGVMTTAPLYYLSGATFCWACMLFFSNTLLRIHTNPYIHAWELPSTTTDIRCWPLSSFTGALLIHFSLFACLTNGLSFTSDFSISKIILFTFKTWGAVIHQVVAVAYWADCALRLHRVTVHHGGSSINWKSVSYSGGMIKMWCAVFLR